MRPLKKIKEDFHKLKKSPELRKAMIYATTSVIAYGIVFIQNFSIAYFVSIDFFGKISLIISLFSMLYVVYTFGLNSVVLRYNFDSRFKADRKKFVSHIVSIWIPLSILTTVILLIFGYKVILLEKYLPIDYWDEFIPILLGAFLFSSVEIFSQLFVVEDNPIGYAFFLIASRFSVFIALHIAVLVYGENSFFISRALLLVGVVIFIICFLVFEFVPIIRLKVENLREILFYTFPLMIYALGGIGYSHGYRVIISNQLSFQNLAIFSIASQIASAYYLAASSSVTGLYPKAYLNLEENQGNPSSIKFYLRALFYIGIGFLIIMLPVSYFFLLYFKAGLFMPAIYILPILLLGQFIFFLYGYNYILCTSYKKTEIVTYSMLAGVTTSLLLANQFAMEHNLWGAAIPILCGLTVQFFLSLYLIKRVIKKNRSY